MEQSAPGVITTRSAMAIVERQYGSVEELAYLVLSERRAVLDNDTPLAVRAAAVGLSAAVLARVLSSPEFKTILRADMVNSRYGFNEESEHIDHMVKVATGGRRRVMNSKGDFGEVDQAPGDVINAGKYLNELRGTPVERQQLPGSGLVVNFYQTDGTGMSVGVGGAGGAGGEGHHAGRASQDAQSARTIEVEAGVHRSRRAGDLPPEGVLSRATGRLPVPTQEGDRLDGALGAFYGAGAQEALQGEALADLAPHPSSRPEPRPKIKNPKWPGLPRDRALSELSQDLERTGTLSGRMPKMPRARAVQRTRPAYDDTGFLPEKPTPDKPTPDKPTPEQENQDG